MGVVYRALCSVTGKSYIGKSLYFEKRKNDHRASAILGKRQTHFYSAIGKYGWDSFSWSILFESDDECLLFEKEKYFITFFDSYNNGYNSTLGGEGCSGHIPSLETRKKISEAGKNRIASPETRKRLSEAKSNISIETREKMSKAARNLSDDKRKKLSDAQPKKEIICIETGDIFPSLAEVARQMKVNSGNVCQSCKTGWACGGFHYKYL